jgi:hypothetical protein
VDQLYSIIFFVAELSGNSDSIAEKDTMVFNKFSEQYLTLLLCLPVYLLISINNISLLIKLSKYAVATLLIYLFFIIYQFIKAVANN